MKNGILHETKHKGKLEGIPSINTTCFNEFCDLISQIETSVCSNCFGRRLERIRKNLHEALKKNAELLSEPIADSDLPRYLNTRFVRFNSFGEISNETHLKNLVRICELNPNTTFALWTKKTGLIHRYHVHYKFPANMILIESEQLKTLPMIGWHVDPSLGFDYRYIVATDAESCGKRCLECLRCYTKPTSGTDRVVFQKLH